MTDIGFCEIVRVIDPSTDIGWYLQVPRADPKVLIAPEILEAMAKFPDDNPWITLVGNVLTINTRTQRIIYHIGEWQPQHHAYLAEWPADQPVNQP